MKFSTIPMGKYRIGQDVNVNGSVVTIESYTHTGRNLIAVSKPGAERFERVILVLTDEPPIEEIKDK